jgi:hypothetical protein
MNFLMCETKKEKKVSGRAFSVFGDTKKNIYRIVIPYIQCILYIIVILGDVGAGSDKL